MAKKFPTFKTHDAAHCFNCGGDLEGAYWRKSGFPARRGEYAQDCRKCGMFTCYDVKEKAS